MSQLFPKVKIHHCWQEIEDAIKDNPTINHIMEKYSYIYSKNGYEISLVQFAPRMYGELCWEICQTKGDKELFDDVERFTSKEAAENRIRELLE